MPKKTLDASKEKLDRTSERFRKLFLIRLTMQLIRHSKVEEFFVLENIIKRREEKSNQDKKEIKEEKRKPLFRNKLMPSIMHREPFRIRELPEPKQLFAPAPQMPRRIQARTMPKTPLRIPEYQLPPTVQHIRPYPTNIQIDLGKLNPLIQDNNVGTIECNGPNENVIVKGNFGLKTSQIILSKEEINQVFQKFSETSKIPIHEGIFKIVVGRLILSAIISEVVGSKFIIKKMISQIAPPSPIMPMPFSGRPQPRMMPGPPPMGGPRRF